MISRRSVQEKGKMLPNWPQQRERQLRPGPTKKCEFEQGAACWWELTRRVTACMAGGAGERSGQTILARTTSLTPLTLTRAAILNEDFWLGGRRTWVGTHTPLRTAGCPLSPASHRRATRAGPPRCNKCYVCIILKVKMFLTNMETR